MDAYINRYVSILKNLLVRSIDIYTINAQYIQGWRGGGGVWGEGVGQIEVASGSCWKITFDMIILTTACRLGQP